MTFELPTGKGMWLWKILYGGNKDAWKYKNGTAQEVIDLCKANGITHIITKCLNGSLDYNLREVETKNHKTYWEDDILLPWVEAFHKEEIKVGGYQYVYLNYPKAEGEAALRRMSEIPFDWLFLDVEKEVYNNCSESIAPAAKFAKPLLNAPFPISLCSFRYPVTEQQNEKLWNCLLNICHFVSPQVYWEGSQNAGQQLEWSLQEYREGRSINNKFVAGLKCDLPFIPVGAAYMRSVDWWAQPNEIVEFMDTAKRLGLTSVSFWELSNIQKWIPGNLEPIGDYKWDSKKIRTGYPDRRR